MGAADAAGGGVVAGAGIAAVRGGASVEDAHCVWRGSCATGVRGTGGGGGCVTKAGTLRSGAISSREILKLCW